jgi:hypothetical protein
MKKSIELYGWVKDITTHEFEVTKKHTFTLVTENGAEFFVQVLDNNLCYDLNTEDYFYVRGVEDEFGIVAGYVDRWGRICEHCGKHHFEGYYVNDYHYACSEECAIALCGSEQEFRDSIWVDEDGELAEDSPTYWTEWE